MSDVQVAERNLNEFATLSSLGLSAVEPKCGAGRAERPSTSS